MADPDYDPPADAYGCWKLAISEMRKKGLIESRFEPKDDEERALLAEVTAT